jgi:hypothetical protein
MFCDVIPENSHCVTLMQRYNLDCSLRCKMYEARWCQMLGYCCCCWKRKKESIKRRVEGEQLRNFRRLN